MPFPSGWGRKGQLCPQLDKSLLFVFLSFEKSFHILTGLGLNGSRVQLVLNPRFLWIHIYWNCFLVAKMEEKRQEGWGGGRDEEGACPWRGLKWVSLNARGIFHSFPVSASGCRTRRAPRFLRSSFGDRGDLFGGGPRLDGEVGFQRTLLCGAPLR